MSEAEYLSWYTNDCPPYIRLDQQAARLKWKRDFANLSIHRDPVEANDEKGNSLGLVPKRNSSGLIEGAKLIFLRINVYAVTGHVSS